MLYRLFYGKAITVSRTARLPQKGQRKDKQRPRRPQLKIVRIFGLAIVHGLVDASAVLQ